jgi:hypothetical protein
MSWGGRDSDSYGDNSGAGSWGGGGGFSDNSGNNDSDSSGGWGGTSSEDNGRGNDYGGTFSDNISGPGDWGGSQSFDNNGSWDNDTSSEDHGRFNNYNGSFSGETLGRGIDRIAYVDGELFDASVISSRVAEYFDPAINRFGEQAVMQAIQTYGLNLEQVQDYGQNTFGEYSKFATTVFSIMANPLSIFSATAQFGKLFSNNINTVHLASEIDHYGSIGSKFGAAIGAYSGLGPAFGMFAIGAGFTVGSMYAEYSVAEDLKAAGIEPVGPREVETVTLSDLLSIDNSGNEGSDAFISDSLSAGTASDQEAGFTLSPSYASNAEKLLANVYLLPVFNSRSLMHSKNILSNFCSASSIMEIKGYDYDGLFGADVFSSVVDAGGMFLFVKAFENKGRLF